jgi:hypothetical protein
MLQPHTFSVVQQQVHRLICSALAAQSLYPARLLLWRCNHGMLLVSELKFSKKYRHFTLHFSAPNISPTRCLHSCSARPCPRHQRGGAGLWLAAFRLVLSACNCVAPYLRDIMFVRFQVHAAAYCSVPESFRTSFAWKVSRLIVLGV